jgi:tetratricopeptide (TPR) repeat protein
MSSDREATTIDDICASCGITAVDNIKLKICTACKLVRYCSVKCQRKHRPQHKRACKKRAAEIRDEILFKMPESTHLGDCPICLLPLPLDIEIKCSMTACCSKTFCTACACANKNRELDEGVAHKCPFCRHPEPKNQAEVDQIRRRRLEANDPDAFCQVGSKRYCEGDYEGAFEYFTKAAELGDAGAHFQLSTMYNYGNAFVERDSKKEVYHLEVAAIKGHPKARHNLGCEEHDHGSFEKAIKHFNIAVSQGYYPSLELLQEFYEEGRLGKEDFTASFRSYQAAIDATKSPQREAVEDGLRHMEMLAELTRRTSSGLVDD